MKGFKSLRSRLMLWYIGSLTIFALFFYFVVHILALPHGREYFFLLFFVLGSMGFFIIFNMTKSLTYLADRIRHISRKNLDERILDIASEDEIGQLASSFNSLLDHLDEAFKRERQFVGDVAHELKTPLATLKSTLEVAQSRKRTSEEYKKVITTAIGEANQLSKTLNNVLDLAWAEVHENNISTKVFSLSQLFEELCDISEKMAETRNIIVKSTIEKEIEITGFRDKLARALLNIIENAIKYTAKGGSITVKLERTHNRAFITISDTGQGIPEAEISHIFDRFFRGSKTDKIHGSGLGLAISKSIVTLHQGYINVESKPKVGTTFTVILPLI